jgi:hypothetical protein
LGETSSHRRTDPVVMLRAYWVVVSSSSRVWGGRESRGRPAVRKRGATPATALSGSQGEIAMFFFSEGFTFRNFLADAFAVFMFVLWFWLLIIVISDLFRRHDISGWIKAIWVIALIVFPYLGILRDAQQKQ